MISFKEPFGNWGHTRKCLTALAAAALCVIAAVPMKTAHAQVPGSFDTTPLPGFANGAGKIANLAIGSYSDIANAVAIQRDGKIVLAGACSNGANDDFCVARLNADGSNDASFVGPLNNGAGSFLLPIGASNDLANALAIQPDGKLVLAGQCLNGNKFDFCVARLNVDGSLDASFDGPDTANPGNGRFLLPIGTGDDYATALAVQPDGKIVLAGYCADGSNGVNGANNDFCVARLNADGTWDANFGEAARNGRFLLPVGTGGDVAKALAIQPDGELVIAGYCFSSRVDFCAARLNADGSLDTSFDGPSGNGNGKVLLPIGTSNAFAFALAIQPDDKLVLAGQCSIGNQTNFCVARLNANGTFDTSFDGPSGAIPSNGALILPIGTSTSYAAALAIQPDGLLLLAGTCEKNVNDLDFCVVRFRDDGSFDESFDGPEENGAGRFLLSMGSGNDSVNAITIQPDGKIVIAGGCLSGSYNDFCVARLNGGPFGAKQCSLDIDGDNVVLATTDMLIGTRVALGIADSTAINGIQFSSNAKRNTWPLIREYLITQCGMRIP
ncbi:MAG: delta-60 repeat domain-containing protein [Casimicrobium sp.]